MNELAEVISSAVNGSKQTSGSDYVGTVTRVEDQTAYVQLAGSDIDDTPVAMTVSCKEGDTVRVRVANGRAWITGNDTAPATDDTEAEKRMLPSMENRDDRIKIEFGVMEFNGNTIVIDSDNLKLDEDGNATFSGNLEAASGYFDGKLVATRKYTYDFGTTATETIYIADPSTSAFSIFIDHVMEDPTDDILNLFMRSDEIILQTKISYTNTETMTVIRSNYVYVSDNTTNSILDNTGVHTSSDRRLKEAITDIDPDAVKALKPVQFRFKNSDKTHFGFIAQDVQKVLPDAVSEDKNGFLSLNYQELIAPLYALVQAQQKQIENLEARLKALEDKLS